METDSETTQPKNYNRNSDFDKDHKEIFSENQTVRNLYTTFSFIIEKKQ